MVVAVRGEIDLHNSPELRTELLDLLVKHGPQRLVLNLAQVPYMDSSAIAVLVELLQKVRKTGGRIFLTNLQPRVKGLLEIARLGSIFGDRRRRGRGAEVSCQWSVVGVPLDAATRSWSTDH